MGRILRSFYIRWWICIMLFMLGDDIIEAVFGIEDAFLLNLIIVIVIVFEPQGLYGRWMKLRFFFETFPYYRKASFVRQKSYLRTERLR